MAAAAKTLTAVLFFVAVQHENAFASDPRDESRLRDKLFKDHPRSVHERPVQLQNHTIDVRLHLGVRHVLEVDEKQETLTFNGWMWIQWLDISVMWNPVEYGGLEDLRVPSNFLWRPDLTIINGASKDDVHPFAEDANLYITYSGNVYWIPPVTMKIACALDFKWFPHDEHHCVVEALSWVYDGTLVNISLAWPGEELIWEEDFDAHNEWHIVRTYTSIDLGMYGGYHWPSAQFHIHLRRQAPYYYYTLIVPVIVAAAMTLTTFWLPPLGSEKLTVASYTILLLTILIVQIYWVIPRSGDSIPGILIMCGNTHAMAGFSVILAVVSSQLCRKPRPSTPFPSWVQAVIHNPVLHKVLFLDATAFSGDTVDVALSVSDEGESEGRQMTAFRATSSALGNDWYLIACILDKMAFYAYCVAFFIVSLVAFA